MAEKQGKHRQFIEKVCIIGDQIRAGCGLLCGLVVALAGLAGAVFLIYNGKQWAGGIFGISMLGSIVTAFIYGSQHQNNQSQEREKTFKK